MSDLRNLKLHEEVRVRYATYVMRVVGGFIYSVPSGKGCFNSVFVPLDLNDTITYGYEEYKEKTTEQDIF